MILDTTRRDFVKPEDVGRMLAQASGADLAAVLAAYVIHIGRKADGDRDPDALRSTLDEHAKALAGSDYGRGSVIENLQRLLDKARFFQQLRTHKWEPPQSSATAAAASPEQLRAIDRDIDRRKLDAGAMAMEPRTTHPAHGAHDTYLQTR